MQKRKKIRENMATRDCCAQKYFHPNQNRGKISALVSRESCRSPILCAVRGRVVGRRNHPSLGKRRKGNQSKISTTPT